MKIVRHVEADQREWLQQLRAAYGWSQVQLADIVGVHFVTVARWELKQRQIASRHRVALNVLAREKGLSPLAPPRRGQVVDIERRRDGQQEADGTGESL